MTSWVRQNADRILLVVFGIGFLVDAMLVRKQQALASVLAALGIGAVALGIMLPRVEAFSLGIKGLKANLGKLAKKVDKLSIRTELANLVARGDQVANALLVAQQMVERQERNRQEPEYDRGVWEEVARWQDEAEDYLRATPELGEPDATLFMSHVDGVDYKLKLPDRFVDTIAIVRERQRRLREMMRRFE